MLDGHAALAGASAAVKDDAIIDVATVFPPGTTISELGGAGAGAAVANASGVGMLATEIALDKSQEAASVVLALSETTLYLLARHRVGPFGSFKHLEIMHAIARTDVVTDLHSGGPLNELTITDSSTGTAYTYEVKPMGSGIHEFLGRLHG